MTDDVRSLTSQAARHLREGRPAEAAEIFQRLTEVEPSQPDHWFNLGYCRRMCRQYRLALEAYAEALRRGVAGSEDVYVNRAVILSEYVRDMPAAAEELRKAVATNPRATMAWLNLGNLYEDLGEASAAREAYSAALKVNPQSGRAIARLAAIDVHEHSPNAAIASLREATRRRWPTLEDAAEVHFALGNALDSAGDYEGAFETIAEANRIVAGPRPRYDPSAQERLVDALIALPPLPVAETLPINENPIFICGMFRSGSTLVEQLLARHSDVTAGGELEFIPAMVREHLLPYPDTLTTISRDRLQGLRDSYLGQLRALFPDARRVTDKRPDNFVHLGLIKALFPRARIVHTMRHPLDNIVSAFFLYFGDDVRYSDRVDDLAHYYAQYRRLMDHWRSRFGDDIHDVDYDALVANPRAELEPLIEFLGLGWEDACLTPETGTAVRTASNWQVRQPLHRKSSGRWRNYASQLEPVRQLLADAGLLDRS